MNLRFLSAMLLAAMLLSTVACTEKTNENSPETFPSESGSAVETDILDSLPVVDMEGSNFTVIGQDNSSRQSFYQEEKTGDTVNDALHSRDILLTERLGVVPEYISHSDREVVTNTVRNTLLADDEAYHLVINALSAGINTLTTSELLLDMCTLPYVRLDAEYWNKSIYNNMKFYGKQYFSAGSIALQYYMTPIVLTFNKKLAEDYHIENLYDTVKSGEWTVDRLNSIVKDLSRDLNNDNKMTPDDFWGLVADGTFGNALYTAAGFNTVSNEDGVYTLTLNSEASVSFIQKCASLFGDRTIIANDRYGEGTYDNTFREGRALFSTNTILGVSKMRDMDDNFGILPVPRYREDQQEYPTACNTWLPSGIGVPFLCSDPERTGLILETMAILSDREIRPAVYDITLQGKVTRDEESREMLDLVYSSTSFDFNTVFNFGDTSNLLRDCVMGEVDNFVSRYAGAQKTADRELQKMMAFAEEN